MCLILELAPRKSLRAILKEYRDSQVCLESLTLKNTALQVRGGERGGERGVRCKGGVLLLILEASYGGFGGDKGVYVCGGLKWFSVI